MKKRRYFQRLYKYDDETKSYLIEVSLDDYNDVYDDWDPAPFKKRDIETEFNDFIVDSSGDIPLNFNVSIVLYLPATKQNTQKETTLITAYHNYYGYALDRLNKDKSNLNKRNTSYLFFSFMFLGIGYFFFTQTNHLLLQILHEGIFIGGWVFLWEFFTNVFIAKRELVSDYRLIKRLYEANILFKYQP